LASSNIELVDEALRDDAIAAVRLRLAVARGAFADLQAMNEFSFDHIRKHAGGLAVPGLSALWRIDAANPDADLSAHSFHREGIAVDDRVTLPR
jgi:hypothetical protein